MKKMYGNHYKNHKVIHIEQYKKVQKSGAGMDTAHNCEFVQDEYIGDTDNCIEEEEGYLYGIISFCGYVATLIVYIIFHLDIGTKEQLLILLAWLGIDFIFCCFYKVIHRHDRPLSLKQTGKAFTVPGQTAKRKLQFYKRIGA